MINLVCDRVKLIDNNFEEQYKGNTASTYLQ